MTDPGDAFVEQLFNQVWVKETSDLCSRPTYRDSDLPKDVVNKNVIQIRDYLNGIAAKFSSDLTNYKFVPFQWVSKHDIGNLNPTDEECIASDFWVIGFRLGEDTAKNKYSIICHIDTVPANDSSAWGSVNPFIPQISDPLEYPDSPTSPQKFLIGRGTVDDKGPAISAFIATRALAKKLDESGHIGNVQIELLFDTSEETTMSFPFYVADNRNRPPEFGVVYDAFWCTRAEKGVERPTFTVHAMDIPSTKLYIEYVESQPNNSVNTIPDYALAKISGDADELDLFAEEVLAKYEEFQFDDVNYNRAKAEVSRDDSGSVIFKTIVAGAQHGSSPGENRNGGANPLVSLANFLAADVPKKFGPNTAATMMVFIQWMWGTMVNGEKHQILEESDTIFEGPDNGTTYAVTKIKNSGGSATLEIDIRYAIPHHSCPWDGVTEGTLQGEQSTFKGIFQDLIDEFGKTYPSLGGVELYTDTAMVPDIRVPETNEDYEKVRKAYRHVMKMEPNMYAIGGGTDARGQTNLLAVGPLMATAFGPPVNYHGIMEGAPMEDMLASTLILYNIFALQIDEPVWRTAEFKAAVKQQRDSYIRHARKLLANGRAFGCNC